MACFLFLVCWLTLSVAQNPISYKIGYTAKDNPANLQTIAGWLGRPLDVSSTSITLTGWFVTSFPSNVALAGVITPMLSLDGWGDNYGATDMGQAASGAYDQYYQNMASALVASGVPILSVRPGHEMNGNWYPWSVGGPGGTATHENYIATFQRMVNIFRQTIPGVMIEFCINWSPDTNPLDYWPGNEYVDVISMDFYETLIGGSFSNAQSGGTYNLDWVVNYAQQQGKQVGLSEWGAGNDDGQYITDAANWMNSLGSIFLYQVYSQYDPADQVINRGQNPNEQAAWIKAWNNTYYSGK